MECDIVLLPDEDLARKAAEVSQSLRPLGSLFTLEEGTYYPHLSLYMAKIKHSDLPKVEQLLARIAKSTPPENLRAVGYDYSYGYVIVDHEKTPTSVALQLAVLNAINPTRDGMLAGAEARMAEATGTALHNYQQYGYRYVGELFHPHITLTRFATDRPDAAGVLPEPSVFDGSFTKLGLFELGEHHTCKRKLAEFDLTGR